MECTWSVRSIPPRYPPSHYHPLTSSLLTSRHYIGSHSCDHFSLSNLVNRSFRLPLHLSLSSLLSYLTSSSSSLFVPVSTPSHLSSLFPFPPSLSFLLPLSLLCCLYLPLFLFLSCSLPSPSPPLPPHTPHRKVMPRLSVLKWDNWTCWRQDQRRTASSRLSR